MLLAPALLLAVEPPPLQAYDIDNPPEGIFSEDWMEIYIAGEKSGYAQMLLRREGDRIHTEVVTYMKIARGVVPLEVHSTETTTETLSGRPLAFSSLMQVSQQPVLSEGLIANGNVTVKTESPGYSGEQVYPFEENALMTWGLQRKAVQAGFADGTEYTVLAYTPGISVQRALTGRVEVIGKETVDYRGTPLEAIRSLTTLQTGSAELVTTSWTEASGRVLLSRVDMMGLPMLMVAVDEATALQDFVPPELFLSTLIELERGVPADAPSVTYQLSLENGSMADKVLPESVGQQVRYDPHKDAALVTVTCPSALSRDGTGVSPLPGGERSLEANLMINSEDPRVLELLDAAALEGSMPPWEKAKRLSAFVHNYINEKNLGVGFASAGEVAETAEGDCSEHAVLLAALGRAAGLPARVAAGLLYLPNYAGKRHIMGYHMWTQFYFPDYQGWVDFDATRPEAQLGPTRVALFYSTLDDDSLAQIGLELINMIGNLQISVQGSKPIP